LEEYKADKIGWGHSPIEFAVEAAKRSKVRRLALFHHDPLRSDDEIDALPEKYFRRDKGDPLEVFFAREGEKIDL